MESKACTEILEALASISPPTPRDYAQRGAESFEPWVLKLIAVQNEARELLQEATLLCTICGEPVNDGTPRKPERIEAP